MGEEESLSVPRGLEPLHAPLLLTCRLVRVFCAIIEIAVLAMFHSRQDFALSRFVAFEFICDDHVQDIR